MSEQSSGPGGWTIFLRLLRLLRPHFGLILIALILLLLSMPAELFPAFIWMYVTDYLILKNPTGATLYLHKAISFGGTLEGWKPLLASAALLWLPGVYIIGEAFGTISSNLMQRVAQRFIRDFRNRVYQKLQTQ